MTENRWRRHHVIPFEHWDTREALVHDVGRVLTKSEREEGEVEPLTF